MARRWRGRSVETAEGTAALASELAKMKREGKSRREIQAATGLAKSTVNNYLRLNRELVPERLADLGAGELPIRTALTLAARPPSSQADPRSSKVMDAARGLSRTDTKRLLAACQRSCKSDEWKAAVTAVLECVLYSEPVADVWSVPDERGGQTLPRRTRRKRD